jgi:oligopeptide transport system substrate-binding protein
VPGGQAIFLNPAFPPLGDVRVRRALAHALLREEFVAMAAQSGVSEALRPATTWLHPDILGIDLTGEVGPQFDPDHARQLLAEAGFEGGEGFPELTLVVDPEHEELGMMAVTMWRDNLGIEVALEVDGGDYLERVFHDPPAIFRLGYFLSPDEPDADTLYKNWFHTDGGNNVLHYSNPRVDELLQAAYDSEEPDARNEMYKEVEALITTDDAIVIPLFHDYTEH